jgi:hypothetical protein
MLGLCIAATLERSFTKEGMVKSDEALRSTNNEKLPPEAHTHPKLFDWSVPLVARQVESEIELDAASAATNLWSSLNQAVLALRASKDAKSLVDALAIGENCQSWVPTSDFRLSRVCQALQAERVRAEATLELYAKKGDVDAVEWKIERIKEERELEELEAKYMLEKPVTDAIVR